MQAAQRILDQAAGVNMNTWIVGRVPVAHLVTEPTLGADGSVQSRGHPLGYTDFKWLTREELQKELAPEYFRGVRNMMAER